MEEATSVNFPRFGEWARDRLANQASNNRLSVTTNPSIEELSQEVRLKMSGMGYGESIVFSIGESPRTQEEAQQSKRVGNRIRNYLQVNGMSNGFTLGVMELEKPAHIYSFRPRSFALHIYRHKEVIRNA